jgi:hypothetical protein
MTQQATALNVGHARSEYINPSIGKVGEMYFDEGNNRIKFFSSELHDNSETIEALVQQGIEMMDKQEATRLNARFFAKLGHKSKLVEARIPLNNGHTGIELLFIGYNTEDRRSIQKVVIAEDDIVEKVKSREITPHEQIQLDYSVEKLTPQNTTQQDIKDMVALYEEAFTTYTTTLDYKAVEDMIANSVVYGVRDRNNKVVSTVVGEVATIETTNDRIRVCELSEMATLREHRGHGLVTYATKMLIDDVRNDLDLIYTEARACHYAINRAFFNLDFEYAGRLNKQCILSGDSEISESGPFENLNIWYVLPNEINYNTQQQNHTNDKIN